VRRIADDTSETEQVNVSRLIEWNGEPIAMLIESAASGSYIAPPLVFDASDPPKLIAGHEVAAALKSVGFQVDSTDGGVWQGTTRNGARVTQPVLLGRSAADLAGIDQHLAEIAETLGLPIGPPGRARRS
jgi:hypothetical protein